MAIKVQDLGMGVLLIEPDYYEDYRGYYSESYSKRSLEEVGIFIDFKQDNHSYTKKCGTIRGIHFQNNPYPQTKLVRCTNGTIMDYVVDLRSDSETYKKWIGIELSKENRKQILIPKGFGHAFITLTDDCEVLYKVDNFYNMVYDRAIKWDDPDINIPWQICNPIISIKDMNAPLLKNSDNNLKINQ